VVFAAGAIIASRPYGIAKTIPEVSIRCAESSLFTACGARVRFFGNFVPPAGVSLRDRTVGGDNQGETPLILIVAL
jgi:hypothetical protein